MRVFLTGASGYLGSVLVQHLAEMPEVTGITGLGLTEPRYQLPGKMRFLKMDIRSPDLRQAMAGHEVVIHAACIVLWQAAMPAAERDDINYNGVRRVAEAALANGVKRFVHASSMAAYDPDLVKGKTAVEEDFPLGTGESPYFYWNAKAQAEMILRETLGRPGGPLLTFLRPIYIIGPRNKGLIANYRKNAVNFPGQNPRRQLIHEDDVARAFLRPLTQEMPGAFNVVPDDFVRMKEFWSLVGARFVPTAPVFGAKLLTWVRWKWFGSAIHPAWVDDMRVDITGSNAKLKKTGWRPQFTSAEAVREAL